MVRVTPLTLLLVRASAPAKVARVPVVGRVTFVAPDTVKVVAKAPEVAKLPPKVIVFPALLTPVPPYWPATTPAFQVPVVMVPSVVMVAWPAYVEAMSTTGLVLPFVTVMRSVVPDVV